MWGVSRVADINPGGILDGVVTSHNACAGGAATPVPADVRVCGGKMVESQNDGGGVVNLNTYPKQPFSFTGRTGKVVFDVSADSDGTHGAWPEFVITDTPVPGVRRSISFGTPAHAINEIGFALDGCDPGPGGTTGVGVIFGSINGNYFEQENARPNCVTKGSSTAMNHIEVRVSTTHIEVWGTDAGSTTLKQLAVEDIAGGLAFSQGLVWMDDVHYNARKAVEPDATGTQFDHSFTWDNLGFDGPKTYRDLGFDVPYANSTATNPRSIINDPETNEGYNVGTSHTFTVTGVVKGSATAARVVFNAYAFEATNFSVSVNGHAAVAAALPDTYAWQTMTVVIPTSDVVAGTNTLTFTTSSASSTIANASLIMVAAAPVP